MRWNLKVPYVEKNEAKALGAMWDPKAKTWYTKNPDTLDKFAYWEPEKQVYAINEKLVAITGAETFKPICNCQTPPWESCPHT